MNILILIAIVFWVSLAGVAYAYAIYPVLLAGLSRVFGRRPEMPVAADDVLPTATLLISAYNEEAVIRARLEDALGLDYPADRLKIVVANDGSADRTAAIVSEIAARPEN